MWTDKEDSAISTIVIRGATDNIMDDVERAVDDGVNTFKALTKVGVCVCLCICDFIIRVFWQPKTIIVKTSSNMNVSVGSTKTIHFLLFRE